MVAGAGTAVVASFCFCHVIQGRVEGAAVSAEIARLFCCGDPAPHAAPKDVAQPPDGGHSC